MIAALLVSIVLVVLAVAVSVLRLWRVGEPDEEFVTPTGYARLGIDSGRGPPSEGLKHR